MVKKTKNYEKIRTNLKKKKKRKLKKEEDVITEVIHPFHQDHQLDPS